MELPFPELIHKYTEKDPKNFPFMVNDLSHIGWDDPFSYEPKDQKAIEAMQLNQERNLYDKSIG